MNINEHATNINEKADVRLQSAVADHQASPAASAADRHKFTNHHSHQHRHRRHRHRHHHHHHTPDVLTTIIIIIMFHCFYLTGLFFPTYSRLGY